MESFARLPKSLLNDDLMPAQAKALYAALDGHLDKRTGECRPSLHRLAIELGITKRYVEQMLTWLEVHGWVVVERGSGKLNRYVSEPAADPRRGFVLKRGDSAETSELQFATEQETSELEFAGTSELQFATTSEPQFAGQAVPLYEDRRIKKEGERRAEAPSPTASIDASKTTLFAGEQRHWLRSAVDYHLGEHPDRPEAALRSWAPELLAEFFLAQSWQRSTDPETALLWARQLAEIAATREETAAALAWSLTAPDHQGKKVFSRPDHLRRIIGYIQSRRQRERAKAAPVAPASAGATINPSTDAEHVWREMSEPEREDVRRAVRQRFGRTIGNGYSFEVACREEALRRRSVQEVPP